MFFWWFVAPIVNPTMAQLCIHILPVFICQALQHGCAYFFSFCSRPLAGRHFATGFSLALAGCVLAFCLFCEAIWNLPHLFFVGGFLFCCSYCFLVGDLNGCRGSRVFVS
jgi:hypothetical protein